jgi:hypothetical protein
MESDSTRNPARPTTWLRANARGLFVADTGFNRVHVWSSMQNALAGQKADIVLGETGFDDLVPEIGRHKTLAVRLAPGLLP